MNHIESTVVEKKIIKIREKTVIIDSDVAELYGVKTKEVNQAVIRNPDKFPADYIFNLTAQEKEEVVTNCDHLNHLKFSKKTPRVFTEAGLYMLATILKSPRATKTTISIIDTFIKVRELDRTLKAIPNTQKNTKKQKELIQKTGELLSDLIVSDQLNNTETEASVELNFAVIKFKYTLKKKPKN